MEEEAREDGSDEEIPMLRKLRSSELGHREDVLEAPASGLAFHPARDLLAAGDVDGDVFVSAGQTKGRGRVA